MLSRKTIEILESRNMTVHDRDKQREEFVREIEFYSPEGEDVCECIFYDGTNEGFVKAFEKNAEEFDAEDHMEVYINIRGTNGIPESIRDLLDDADWIKNTLVETAKELKEAFIKEDNFEEAHKFYNMGNEENFPILTKEPKLKFVTDLTKEQLSELKQSYKTQLLEDSDISYEELIDAEKIPDEVIFNHYEDMTFSDDDFFCSSN